MDQRMLFSLMVDLHRDGWRQGPGSDDETLRALELTRFDRNAMLNVADIGCGTGAATLVLARELPNARIAAADLFPEFLEILEQRAVAAGCSGRIETLAESMYLLPFAEESLDLIWSEGAIYNMGFRIGVEAWRPFLKPGGLLAVSEITWLRSARIGKSQCPRLFARPGVDLRSKLQTHRSTDQARQKQKERGVKTAEHRRVRIRESGKQSTTKRHQPDFISVPKRADRVHYQPTLGVRFSDERMQHPDAQIESVKDRVAGNKNTK